MYCREFAYSIIFGNLRTGNLPAILQAVEIERAPNIMFLIQIDDHHSFYTPYPEFTYFPYRSNIVAALQAKLKELNIDGVVSRFLGHETIGAFLHIEGKSLSDDDSKAFVNSVAAGLIEYVYVKTGENISIGISDFCSSIAQFPRAYSECKSALSYAFYAGRRSIEIYDRQKPQPKLAKQDFSHMFFTRYISYIDNNDIEACRATAGDMVDCIAKANVSPMTSRLLIAAFVGRVADYYISVGHDVDVLIVNAQDSIVDLFNSNFMEDFPEIMTNFCEKLSKLQGGFRQSPDDRFRKHIDDCLERHSSDCLFDFSVIASMSNYSPSYFSRLFTRIYGIPFSQYLAEYRVDRAKKLLMNESLTLQEISQKAGFSSTSYFCSVFKKKTGKSPRQYAAEEMAQFDDSLLYLDDMAFDEKAGRQKG